MRFELLREGCVCMYVRERERENEHLLLELLQHRLALNSWWSVCRKKLGRNGVLIFLYLLGL